MFVLISQTTTSFYWLCFVKQLPSSSSELLQWLETFWSCCEFQKSKQSVSPWTSLNNLCNWEIPHGMKIKQTQIHSTKREIKWLNSGQTLQRLCDVLFVSLNYLLCNFLRDLHNLVHFSGPTKFMYRSKCYNFYQRADYFRNLSVFYITERMWGHIASQHWNI